MNCFVWLLYLIKLFSLNTITWNDFEKIEIRTGTIIEAEEFLGAKKPAYKILIDFGEHIGQRKSSAQITAFYQPQELKGKQIIAIINFPPKQIATFMSECLVLGVYDADGKVVLLQPDRPVDNGLKIG